MTPEQKAAGEAALDTWAAPLIASASIFTRSSYEGFVAQHRDELVAAIGEAVLAVPVAQPDAPVADTGAAA